MENARVGSRNTCTGAAPGGILARRARQCLSLRGSSRRSLETWVLLASLATPAFAQTAWLNPASGTWSTAANWSGGVPTGSVDTTINVTGSPYIVSQSGGTISARTLSINSADATLARSGSAVLDLSTTAASTFSQGQLTLNASRVSGKYTPGSGFNVRSTAGSSTLELDNNDGTLRR